MEFFMVGGCVRDEIMGVKSNDIDFTIVLSEDELDNPALTVNPRTPFQIMKQNLEDMGFEIFVSTPEFLTIRARVPKPIHGIINTQSGVFAAKFPNQTFDFVLARKEGAYTDGRRPDSVEVGTLSDDLGRRDFRMNAIARSLDGEIIDPFNGRQDINERVIRAVGDARDRLEEDALRAVRALRFAVTTGFRLDHELMFAMQLESVLAKIRTQISDERIKDELNKMLKVDTIESIRLFATFKSLTSAMFDGRVWLQATMKEK